MVRWSALLVSSALVAGCAMPPSLRVASWAVDGLAYIATDKSIADHGLSALSGKDCKVLRLASAKSICIEPAPGVDFNGNLDAQGGSLMGTVRTCDLPTITEALPDHGRMNQCATDLVERFGPDGALAYSDWHITQLIDAGYTDDAGVWMGIRAAVRDTAEAPNG